MSSYAIWSLRKQGTAESWQLTATLTCDGEPVCNIVGDADNLPYALTWLPVNAPEIIGLARLADGSIESELMHPADAEFHKRLIQLNLKPDEYINLLAKEFIDSY